MDLNRDKNSALLLFDVGGTFIKAGVAVEGKLIGQASFTSPIRSEGTAQEICDALTQAVERGMEFARCNELPVAEIGVAIPGPFDYAHGIALMKHKFAAIYSLSLRELIGGAAGGLPVHFVHDVNAVLLGEMYAGAARGFDNAAVITLGTGLGFSFAHNGEVQCSPTGSPLVSIYNRPYGDGILEDYASKRGFLATYARIASDNDSSLTVARLGQMAAEGDEQALETFERVALTIASSVRDILAQKRIDCLLFGGQISRSFRFMESALHKSLGDLPYLKRIAAVENIDSAAFYGVCKVIYDNRP